MLDRLCLFIAVLFYALANAKQPEKDTLLYNWRLDWIGDSYPSLLLKINSMSISKHKINSKRFARLGT